MRVASMLTCFVFRLLPMKWHMVHVRAAWLTTPRDTGSSRALLGMSLLYVWDHQNVGKRRVQGMFGAVNLV
jgi:hypothetical protein